MAWVQVSSCPKCGAPIYKRKFKRGEKITNLTDLMVRLERGEWVYYRRQPKHPQFILQWSLANCAQYLAWGLLFVAERQEQVDG